MAFASKIHNKPRDNTGLYCRGWVHLLGLPVYFAGERKQTPLGTKAVLVLSLHVQWLMLLGYLGPAGVGSANACLFVLSKLAGVWASASQLCYYRGSPSVLICVPLVPIPFHDPKARKYQREGQPRYSGPISDDIR